MRTVVASVLGIVLAAGPVFAQQPSFSLARAAREEAVKQAGQVSSARAPMSPAMKWTGIGMLIGGASLLASGVLVDNACIEEGEYSLDFCQDIQTAWIATGGAIAAGGAAVLLVGNSKRQSVPSINLGARRVSWRIRF
jgi:hypothetical protein